MLDAQHEVDVAVFSLIHQLPHPTWTTALMWAFSLAGSAGSVWIIAAAIIAIRNQDFGGFWRVLLAVSLTTAKASGKISSIEFFCF